MNLISGKLSVAVCLLDGICHFCREGRCCNIHGTRQNGVQSVRLTYVINSKVLYLRCTVEVFVICSKRNYTVLILFKNISTCTKRLGCLLPYRRKIALREAELILIIVKLCLITIVMKRCHKNSQLINHLRINLGSHNTKSILSGLLDTADVRSGLTGLYPDSIVLVAWHKFRKLGSGALCRTHLCYASVILLEHSVKEVHSRSVIL